MVTHMSAGTIKVRLVEMMMNLGCDDRGCAAIDAAAAAAVGIDAAAAGQVVAIAPIEDWADYECWSVASVVGLGLEGQCLLMPRCQDYEAPGPLEL